MRSRTSRVFAVGTLSLLMVSACGDSGGLGTGFGGQNGSIDLGAGETQQEQIAEIEKVVELMEDQLGRDYAFRDGRSGEWSPEYHEKNRRPMGDCPEGSLRNRVVFDFTGLDPESAYAGAEVMAQELGFAGNGAVNNDVADGKAINFAARGEGGRTLLVRQQSGDERVVEVFYYTACSDHESLQEALDRLTERVGDQMRREREERLNQE